MKPLPLPSPATPLQIATSPTKTPHSSNHNAALDQTPAEAEVGDFSGFSDFAMGGYSGGGDGSAADGGGGGQPPHGSASGGVNQGSTAGGSADGGGGTPGGSNISVVLDPLVRPAAEASQGRRTEGGVDASGAAHRDVVAASLGRSAGDGTHGVGKKGQDATVDARGRIKGNVYVRGGRFKRLAIKPKRAPQETSSSSNDDDDFMTVNPTAATPAPSGGPRTRQSAKAKEAAQSTARGKRTVTNKEPAAQDKKRNRMIRDYMESQPIKTASKAKRSATVEETEAPSKAPRWNIRCAPDQIAEMCEALTEPQKKEFIYKYHLQSLLDIKLEGSGAPSLLKWLYKHIDPKTMVLKIGHGKEIKLTKEIVHQVLGLRNSGESIKDDASWSAKVNEAKKLREELNIEKPNGFHFKRCMSKIREKGTDHLTKRIFFLVLFNRMFFSTANWAINNYDIGKTMYMDNFNKIDWCHMIFQELCNAVKQFHEDLEGPTQVAYSISGCSTVILLWYLDWLDHVAGPEERFKTPRIKFFTQDIVENLRKADVVHERQSIAYYGKLNFRPLSQTCYMSASDFGTIAVPKMSQLLASKLACLRGSTRHQFEQIIAAYDQDVDNKCQTIQTAVNSIIDTQKMMSAAFAEMIDNAILAAVGALDDWTQPEKDASPSTHGGSGQQKHTVLNQPHSPKLGWNARPQDYVPHSSEAEQPERKHTEERDQKTGPYTKPFTTFSAEDTLKTMKVEQDP